MWYELDVLPTLEQQDELRRSGVVFSIVRDRIYSYHDYQKRLVVPDDQLERVLEILKRDENSDDVNHKNRTAEGYTYYVTQSRLFLGDQVEYVGKKMPREYQRIIASNDFEEFFTLPEKTGLKLRVQFGELGMRPAHFDDGSITVIFWGEPPSKRGILYLKDSEENFTFGAVQCKKGRWCVWLDFPSRLNGYEKLYLDYISKYLIHHLELGKTESDFMTFDEYKDEALEESRRAEYVKMCKDRLDTMMYDRVRNHTNLVDELARQREVYIDLLRQAEVARLKLLDPDDLAETIQKRLEREYDTLKNHPKIQSFAVTREGIEVKTKNLFIVWKGYEYDMGRFSIKINQYGEKYVESLDYTMTTWGRFKMSHPHVYDWGICLGNTQEGIDKLIARQEYAVVIPMIIRVLESIHDEHDGTYVERLNALDRPKKEVAA